jgi:hypothetical protein
MEIEIPLTEFEADHPNVGDFGEITLRVEVMEVGQEHICVLKHGPVKITKPFKEMGSEDMKKKMDVVEDPEEPINKYTEEKEND